jgi:hypothetical protein
MDHFELDRDGASGLSYQGQRLLTTTASPAWPFLRAWCARPCAGLGIAPLAFAWPLRLRAPRPKR